MSRNATTEARPLIVSILDTGGDPFQSDGATWINPGEGSTPDGIDGDLNGFVDDIVGWDFVTMDNNVYDWGSAREEWTPEQPLFSHGQAMADLVVESSEGSATIQMLRVAPGNGPIMQEGLESALAYAAASSTDIVLLSLGGNWNDGAAMAVSSAAMKSVAQVFVVAAGNSGREIAVQSMQAQMCLHGNVVCVASADLELRELGTELTPSDFGPTVVDVAADGGPYGASALPVDIVDHIDSGSPCCGRNGINPGQTGD